MTSEILQLMFEQKWELAAAYACQLQKVTVQLAIDGGTWGTAYMLWPPPDPLQGETFGGTEEEMHLIHRYRKAVHDLQTKHATAPGAAEDAEGEAESKVEEPGTTRRRRSAKGLPLERSGDG